MFRLCFKQLSASLVYRRGAPSMAWSPFRAESFINGRNLHTFLLGRYLHGGYFKFISFYMLLLFAVSDDITTFPGYST